MDVRHLVVNFGSLEVDFRIDGKFRLLGSDFRHIRVYHEPKGSRYLVSASKFRAFGFLCWAYSSPI